jgi:tRNA threonylcarbamoyladenosine modification (KEOPS) complex  Pcc1 subunit
MAHTQDTTAARETYEGFIRLIKVSTPIIAVISALVVYLISR